MTTALLLIDDDDLSREVLALLFSGEGYSVTALASGDEALAWIAAEADAAAQLDAVLTDLQMPGTSGPELAAALRPVLPSRTTLIAMSGSMPATATIEGFDGFLLKPLTPADLRDLLRGRASPGAHGTDTRAAAASAETAEVGKEAHHPVLEEKTYAELSAMMRPEQMTDLLRLSLAEVARYTGLMRTAMHERDASAWRAAAHSLKGSVAMIGARELQALAGRLELGDGVSANQRATFAEITPAAERLRRILISRGIELGSSFAPDAHEDTIA